jgi:hypothetical protein
MGEGRLFSTNARIDIATNFASFDSIDFAADFEAFVHRRLGPEHLLGLIHEATHHWCLTTPVGTALAATTFRTYHDAALIAAETLGGGPQTFAHERKEALDRSIFVSRTVTSFFVPLLEGMALYAEWRACPAVGGTFSRPFDLLGLLSAPAGITQEDRALLQRLRDATDGLDRDAIQVVVADWTEQDDIRRLEQEGVWDTMATLARVRRLPSQRKRLRHVFRTSMDPRRSGYQLGYLFVCALERICDAHSRSDTLLAFLREHFFDDLELAALILDHDCPMEELYGEVRARLQAKVFELVTDPAAAAARVRAWGDRQEFTLPMNDEAEDFFRYSSPPGQEDARAAYTTRIREFCHSAASPMAPPEQLEEFLVLGRVMMPVGSKELRCRAKDGQRLALAAEDGTEVVFATAGLATAPSVGDAVTVAMLVNVASAGSAVSLRWENGFEALSLTGGDTSKTLIEQFYAGSEAIGLAVSAGQEAMGLLQRELPGGSEPLEAFIDDHLNGDHAALDVLQIYRAPIVRAFSIEQPEVFDSRWRTEAFRRWQPNGISTILGSGAPLDDFLKVSGMPVHVHIDRDALAAADPKFDGAATAEGELFELLNGSTTYEHDAIAKVMDNAFAGCGLQLFGETRAGRLASLI